MSSFTITYDKLPDPLFDALPESAKKRFLEIGNAIVEEDVSYIKKAEEFIAEYPHFPRTYSLLEGLYALDDQEEKMQQLAKSMYQKFPDYLFAKTTYASWCMTNGDIDAFERIFEGKHNLKLLYPHRDSFHVEEFLIFMDIVCRHACHQANFDYVRQILKLLKKIPESACITDLIKHRLFMFENLPFITTMEQSSGRGEAIHVNKNNNASKRKKK